MEGGRRDARDVEGLSADHDPLPQRRVASSEPALPVRIAENGGIRRTAAAIVAGVEQASSMRRESECREELATHPDPPGSARVSGAIDGGRHVEASPGEDRGHGLLMRPYALPHRIREALDRVVGDADARASAEDGDLDQFVRTRDRQASQPDGVQELENRGVGANSQPEREHRGQREARAEAQ